MRLKIAALFIATLASVVPTFAQASAYPDCYWSRPDLTYGIVVSVANLAQRMAGSSILPNGSPNIFVNIGDPVPNVASGEILSIIGTNLVTDSTVGVYGSAWTNQLNGAQVLINGVPAPMLYAGKRRDGLIYVVAGSEILVQLPYGVTGSSLSIQVSVTGSTCNGLAFTTPVTTTSTGLIRNQDGSVAVETGTGALLASGKPVHANDELIVYLVGGGDVTDSSLQAGVPVTKAIRVVNNPALTVNGQSVVADYVGLTPSLVGVYQINFRVPALGAGTYTVKINAESFAITVQ